MMSFYQKIFAIGVCKKKIFFLPPGKFFFYLVVFRFLEFDSKLHRISSTDFKFHRKICIRLEAITFWIFAKTLSTWSETAKLYNSRTDAYFSMKFDVAYYQILKNGILLNKKKISRGAKTNFFFANSDRKNFLVKAHHLGLISTSISFIRDPCSKAEI